MPRWTEARRDLRNSLLGLETRLSSNCPRGSASMPSLAGDVKEEAVAATGGGGDVAGVSDAGD